MKGMNGEELNRSEIRVNNRMKHPCDWTVGISRSVNRLQVESRFDSNASNKRVNRYNSSLVVKRPNGIIMYSQDWTYIPQSGCG